ncbi:uncharacterized protein METZ01_LOCUS118207 [marine metagenome]|uniref:Uncharacterized protein n=1 Tax=marine metagenome TaxID=408172 RepID=A0A381XM84_9ZZZZ
MENPPFWRQIQASRPMALHWVSTTFSSGWLRPTIHDRIMGIIQLNSKQGEFSVSSTFVCSHLPPPRGGLVLGLLSSGSPIF